MRHDLSRDEPNPDPKRAAIDAELASDRGEITEAEGDALPEAFDLGDELGVTTALKDAERAEAQRFRAQRWPNLMRRIAAWWNWGAKKDYTVERDPITGEEMRVYDLGEDDRP